MTTPDFEDEIRTALRHRADQAGAPAPPQVASLAARRPPVRALMAAGAIAAAVTGVTAFAVGAGQDQPTQLVRAAPGADVGAAERTTTTEPATTTSTTAPDRVLPEARVPRLAFEGTAFTSVEECEDLGSGTGAGAGYRFQRFSRTPTEGPMLFLWTLDEVTPDFGLVTAAVGVPFVVRGATGYAARERGAAVGWSLSVVLPDGRAVYGIASGLELDEVVPVLDGLAPRPDGTWEATDLPGGMVEVAPATVSSEPHCYSATAGPADGGEPFEVHLYQDPFDQRLADRAASTQGPIGEVRVDGFAASIGSYGAADHWVMLEPEPGRTLEIRASGPRSASSLPLPGSSTRRPGRR